jgi:hypothetical protein
LTIAPFLHVAGVCNQPVIAVESRLSSLFTRLFSGPSASLQRGLNPPGDTYPDGTTKQGRHCGLSATKHDARLLERDIDPAGRMDQEQEPVMMLDRSPRWVDSTSMSGGDCLAIKTRLEW